MLHTQEKLRWTTKQFFSRIPLLLYKQYAVITIVGFFSKFRTSVYRCAIRNAIWGEEIIEKRKIEFRQKNKLCLQTKKSSLHMQTAFKMTRTGFEPVLPP